MTVRPFSSLTEAGALLGDELLAISRLSDTIRIEAATISAQASDNSFNDSADGFIAAGFAEGERVNVIGFTGDTANNLFFGTIETLAAGKMIIASPEGDAIVDDAAGESVTIAKWETRRVDADTFAIFAVLAGLPDMTGKGGLALYANDSEDGFDWLAAGGGGGGGGGGSFEFVQTLTALAASEIDVELSAEFVALRLIVAIAPSDDDIEIRGRISDDAFATVESGGTDYAYNEGRASTPSTLASAGSTGADHILLNSALGNTAGRQMIGVIDVMLHADANLPTDIRTLHQRHDGSGVFNTAFGGGRYLAASAVDGLRIYPSAGTLDYTVHVFGMRAESPETESGMIHIQHREAQNVAGGGLTSGSDQTRVLNHEASNVIAGASVDTINDQFTLPPGDYWIEASIPYYRTDQSRAWLYNVTDAAIEILGSSVLSDNSTDGDLVVSLIRGQFSIDTAKTFEIRSRVTTTNASNGGGPFSNFSGQEIYSDVMIRKRINTTGRIGLLHIQDQKSAGTNGGDFNSGAWRTRDLNTVLYNTISGASLVTNQITLPAGTYRVNGSAPAHQVETHQTRLRDITAGATLLLGSSERTRQTSATDGSNRSVLSGIFSLSSNSVLEIQHQCSSTMSSSGLGLGSSNTWGATVFTEVTIEKIG